MKRVYVVSVGEYSDRHTEAIFSTRDKAKAFMRAIPNRGYNDIEEWPVDKHTYPRPDGLVPYRISMGRDGSVAWCYREANGEPARFMPEAYPPHVCGIVMARDKRHAIKIANDMRRQVIAENLWMPEPERMIV